MSDQKITLETCFQVEKSESDDAAWAPLVDFAQAYRSSGKENVDAVRMTALAVDDVMLTHFRNEVDQQEVAKGESRADVLQREGYYERVSAVTKKINADLGKHIS